MASPTKKKQAPNNVKFNADNCTMNLVPKPRSSNNMANTFHKHISNGGQRFKCSCFRAKVIKGKCTAYLKVYPNKAEEEIELVGKHAPGCFNKNVIQMEVLPKAEDYTNAMHQFVRSVLSAMVICMIQQM